MIYRFLSITLSLSVALNIFLLLQKENPEREQTALAEDQVTFKKSALKKQELKKSPRDEIKNIKTQILDINPKENSDLQKTEVNDGYLDEEEVQRAEQAWVNSAGDFLSASIGLREEEIRSYFKLSDDRNNELNRFIRERIEAKGRDQFFYTVEDIVLENKINEKYLSRLKGLLGQDGYDRYKQFRDEYNQKIIESGEGFYLIEL